MIFAASAGQRRGDEPDELRDRCLSLPGAEETFPFGPKTSVFKVAGKMFALPQLGADPLRVSVKCEPELAEALRAAHPAVVPRIPPQQASLEHRDHRWLPHPTRLSTA